jgi:hypothetical protein
MKSYKVRDGKVLVDGIMYGQTTTDVVIAGKAGRVHSINIGTSKFFPISGVFNDGSIPLVTDNTGLVDKTSKRTKKVK